jgi:hypothetical protein
MALDQAWARKYLATRGPYARRSKYGAQKVVTFDADGNQVKIDSKLEARRFGQLQLMQKAGEISNLRRQVRFDFKSMREPGKPVRYVDSKRAFHYLCDFVYERDGKTIYEDAKGVSKREYLIKKMFMWDHHGILLTEHRRPRKAR